MHLAVLHFFWWSFARKKQILCLIPSSSSVDECNSYLSCCRELACSGWPSARSAFSCFLQVAACQCTLSICRWYIRDGDLDMLGSHSDWPLLSVACPFYLRAYCACCMLLDVGARVSEWFNQNLSQTEHIFTLSADWCCLWGHW